MSAPLLLVLLVPLLLVVPLVAGLVAWALLRPEEGEPVARARLRRGSGSAAAAATATAALVLLPSALLAMRAPVAGAAGVVVAGVLHVLVLWGGETLTARPRAARRTALLVDDRVPARRALAVVLAASLAGLVGLAVARTVRATTGRGSDLLSVTVVVAGLAAGLAVLVALAVRQVARRSSDARLDPEVDALGRGRATLRLLKGGAAATAAALGLLLLGERPLAPGWDAAPGSLAATVLGLVLLVVAAAASLWALPALPLRPDAQESVAAGAGPGAA